MQNKKATILSISAFSALLLVVFSGTAYAATATVAQLRIQDSSGNDKVLFNFGETVYIKWTADGTVDVNVFSEGGAWITGWPDQANVGQVSFVPSEIGIYYVSCTGVPGLWPLAVGSFHVVPDIPFGTVMALSACFIAFGIIRMKHSK